MHPRPFEPAAVRHGAQDDVIVLKIRRPRHIKPPFGQPLQERRVGAVADDRFPLVHDMMRRRPRYRRIVRGEKPPGLAGYGGEVVRQLGRPYLADIGVLLRDVVVRPVVGVNDIRPAVLDPERAVDAAHALRRRGARNYRDERSPRRVGGGYLRSADAVPAEQGDEEVESVLVLMHLAGPDVLIRPEIFRDLERHAAVFPVFKVVAHII